MKKIAAPRILRHDTGQPRSSIMPLQLSSSAFARGGCIPRRHTGDGEDLSPPLDWAGVPDGIREFALLVDDPDAPTSEPWVHWILYRIPATETGIVEGVHPKVEPPFPAGAFQGKNSWGTNGYRGPAPPKGHGLHRYIFRLFALDAALSVAPGLDKRALLKAIQGHVLAEAEMVGTYERK
jgi:Raf kinase inhibitor-like YbhB/YbcL family protein